MASEQDLLSWGVNQMSLIFPRPRTGTAVLIEGSRQSSLRFVIEMLCEEISSDGPVYWVDGGMSLDPSALIRPLSARGLPASRIGLLRACRAFTAHQMVDLLRRLDEEIRSYADRGKPRLVVITDLAKMFADRQLKGAESRAMLEECLDSIQMMSKNMNLLFILTLAKSDVSRNKRNMTDKIRRAVDERITIKSWKEEHIVATNHMLDLTTSPMIAAPFSATLLDFYPADHSSIVVCTSPPFNKISSVMPNGESMDSEARSASAL